MKQKRPQISYFDLFFQNQFFDNKPVSFLFEKTIRTFG